MPTGPASGPASSNFRSYNHVPTPYGTSPEASPVTPRHPTPAHSAASSSPTSSYRAPPGVTGMVPPSNPAVSPYSRPSSVGMTTPAVSTSRAHSVSHSTSETQGHGTPMTDRAAIASFPRSSIEQACLFDAPQSEFDAVIQSMQQQRDIINLEKEHADHLESCESAQGGRAKANSAPVLANEHPQMKRLIHSMSWSLLGISEKDFESLSQHKPLEDGKDFVELEDGTKTWHPRWLDRLDNVTNKRFINAIATQVYENEKSIRALGDEGHIPAASFDLDKMKSLAQDYVSNLATRYKERQSTAGSSNREKRNQSGKARSKRATKTKNRRWMAHVFEKIHNVTGALTLLDTDFASSTHETKDALLTVRQLYLANGVENA
ncbi:hypothetical protein BKA93DRAFT_926622 [Sparassis latifolia]